MKLDKYDPKIANGACADSDQSRPVLNCICLRDGRWAAVDGYLLVVRDADISKDEVLAQKERLIPATIIRGLKPTEKQPVTLVGEDNGSINAEQGDSTTAIKPHELGTFPHYEPLFPPSEKLAQFSVDLKLLRKMLTCLPNEGTIRFGVRASADPIEFCVSHIPDAENDDRPIRGCIMPMFTDWQDFKWWRDAHPEKKEEVSTNG